MVKRSNEKQAPKSQTGPADDDSIRAMSTDHRGMPYMCTGHFLLDYVELCRRHDPAIDFIPAVIPRPHRPRSPTPLPVIDEKILKPGKGAKNVPPPPEMEPETLISMTEFGELPEAPPKTYTVKDRLEYFRPCIQVETDYLDKQDTVTEIYIRGWKIDETMMNIFSQCWPLMTKLNTINLWSAGLTDTTLAHLASFIQDCVSLKALLLDNNPVKGEGWHALLKDESPVQHLSLRYNSITDIGAELLGTALGTFQRQNQKLISLTLSGNKITDRGARHLANGLRFNRCLVSLNIAYNRIGDDGAKHFAEVLSRFTLTHEEIVARRQLLSSSIDRKTAQSPAPSSRPGDRAGSRDRPGSVRSTATPALNTSTGGKSKSTTKTKKSDIKVSKEEDTKHGKGGKGKEMEKPSKKDTPQRKSSTVSLLPESKSVSIGGRSKTEKGRKKMQAQSEPEVTDMSELVNPLLEPAESLPHGIVLMKGNMTLISLNLAGNVIGNAGVEAFSHCLRYQATLLQTSAAANSRQSAAPGLMRLVLQKNKVLIDSGVLLIIHALLAARDPIAKPSGSRTESEISF